MTNPHNKDLQERWKSIPNYEGRYEISNLGEVASLCFARGKRRRILAQSTNTWGYRQVTLSKNKVKKNVTVHKLVAEAFLENPDNLPQVNHVDEDKTNNCVNNLEWCSSKHNVNHGTRTIRASEAMKRRLIATLPDGSEEYYNSFQDACKALNISRSTISRAVHGKLKTAAKRTWRTA